MKSTRIVGDHGTPETFELAGAGLSTAGATGVAHIRRPDGIVLDRAVTFDDVRASFVWQDGDLSVKGMYAVEIEVTYIGGAQQTFRVGARSEGVSIHVIDQLG